MMQRFHVPTVDELFARWQLEKGELSAEEVCREVPDLLPALLRRIADCTATQMTPPLPAPGASDPAPALPAIAGYTLIKKIAEGGQGAVFQAMQHSPHRRVAIKILLNAPYSSKAARHRFEREIELVATLRHPHVVAVFDSGKTADGHLYYAMDYVRGVAFTDYVRNNKLSMEKTLELFATACDAVNHAHQKGVMHRDLKPANILVDEHGHLHVLDFGLAKQITEVGQTLVSNTGLIMGTLPYMSPEQTRGNPDLLDIRTDVYALGVILYELLTGTFPYPVLGAMADVLHHIANSDPRPLTKTWSRACGVHTSARRSRRAGCPINDEVETIALKALSKQRERRYQSAGELGRDVLHFLRNEAIEAKRDSGFYLLKRAFLRYRAAAVLVMLFVAMLLTLTITFWTLRTEANRQRDIARNAAAEAARQRALAEDALQRERNALADNHILTASLEEPNLPELGIDSARSVGSYGEISEIAARAKIGWTPAPDQPMQDLPEVAAGPSYPLTAVALRYADDGKGAPALADLMDSAVQLGIHDGTYVTPGKNVPLSWVRLSDIGRAETHRISHAAIQLLFTHTVNLLRARGMMGMWVTVDPDDIDAAEKDLRPATRSALRLIMFFPPIDEVRTVSMDPAIPEGQRINRPDDAFVLENSPIKPAGHGAPDKIDRNLLVDYVSQLRGDHAVDVVAVVVTPRAPLDNHGVTLEYRVTRPRNYEREMDLYRKVFFRPQLDENGKPVLDAEGRPRLTSRDSEIRNDIGYSWRQYQADSPAPAAPAGFPAFLRMHQHDTDPKYSHCPDALASLQDLHELRAMLERIGWTRSSFQVTCSTLFSRARPPNIRDMDFPLVLDAFNQPPTTAPALTAPPPAAQ